MNLKYDIYKLTNISCEVTVILEYDDAVALNQRNQEVDGQTVSRTLHYDAYRVYQQDTLRKSGLLVKST